MAVLAPATALHLVSPANAADRCFSRQKNVIHNGSGSLGVSGRRVVLGGSQGQISGAGLYSLRRALQGQVAKCHTDERRAGGKVVAQSTEGPSSGRGWTSVLQKLSDDNAAGRTPEAITSVVGTALLAATAYTVFNQATRPGIPIFRGEVKQASSLALKAIKESFPDAMWEDSFITACAAKLYQFGFSRDNCIALVNTCRDEVCRPLVQVIDREFGQSFNISGLGGLITCGTTGMGAGMSHSPQFKGPSDGQERERYIFFAFPHVSVGETGEVGSLLRRGRGRPSSACGALIKVQGEIKSGNPRDDYDNDLEYTLLRKKIAQKSPLRGNDGSKDGPSLVSVTKAAVEVITEDLEALITKTVNTQNADYAVVTGVQIHSASLYPGEPFNVEKLVDYVAPHAMYAVVRGQRFDILDDVKKIQDSFVRQG